MAALAADPQQVICPSGHHCRLPSYINHLSRAELRVAGMTSLTQASQLSAACAAVWGLHLAGFHAKLTAAVHSALLLT